jgi:putative ABC transport system permease protein
MILLKSGIRNLWKNKTYSAINIIGLVVGTVCCLYLLLFVSEHYNYDSHHKDAENIFRINTTLKSAENTAVLASASPPIAPAMSRDFAEVLQFTRVVNTFNVKKHLLKYGDKSFYEEKMYFVDSTFFDIFSYHFVHGDPATALKEPNSVVLFESVSTKLFGNENPVGKTIEIDNSYGKSPFKVTGVVNESLGKSHLQTNILITMNSGGIGEFVLGNDMWSGNNFTYSYIKTHPDTDVAQFEKKLPAFINLYGHQQLKDFGFSKEIHLQSVSSIHNTVGFENETTKIVSSSFLKFLLIIAGLIQLIACINFMNLSTARASKRAKEVGVRKVIGAGKSDLIRQFLGESMIISCISIVLALFILYLAMPLLNQLTQSDLSFSLLKDINYLMAIAGLTIITGLVAGSYPAFYLSAFRVIKVFKGEFNNYISVKGVRKSLVVFQFVFSIALITGIIIIKSQLNYLQNKDLGFATDQQLIFTFHTEETQASIPAFIEDLKQLPEVSFVSKANNYPSQFVFNDMSLYPPGGNMSQALGIQFMIADEHFIDANGIELLSGRNFRLHDSTGVLVNETVIKKMGLSNESAPGTRIFSQRGSTEEDIISFEILGVMKDFNYNSLHEELNPFMMQYDPENSSLSNVIVRTDSKDYASLLGKIEKIWNENVPATPFEYVFLEDEVQKQYETESTLSGIINAFTMIAILISCLGLLGLTIFSAEQRKKEFGIRKVIGASVSDIVTLISKDFMYLILISFLIAIPVVWWAMSEWLKEFAYQIELSWWMFALAGLMTATFALITICLQAIRSATANPVQSLKSE